MKHGDDRVWMHGGHRLRSHLVSEQLPIASPVVLACCAGGVKVCRRGMVYGHTPKRVRVLWLEGDGRKWVKRGLVDPARLRLDILTLNQMLAPHNLAIHQTE